MAKQLFTPLPFEGDDFERQHNHKEAGLLLQRRQAGQILDWSSQECHNLSC